MFDTYGVYWFSDKLYTYCRLSLRITVINYTITLKFLNSNPVGCGKVETWARRSNRSPGSWIITMNIIFNGFFYHCGLSLKEHINGKGKDVFANGNDFTLIQLSLWVIVTLGSTINGLSVKMTFKLPRGWYLIQIQDEIKKNKSPASPWWEILRTKHIRPSTDQVTSFMMPVIHSCALLLYF